MARKNPETATTQPTEALIRVRNTKPRAIDLPPAEGFGSRTLLPGGNNVPTAYLSALRSHEGARWYFDQGWLVIQPTGEGEPEGPEAPSNLSAYSEEGAVILAGLEANPDTLRQWAAAEGRSKVAAALSARLTALKVGV